MFFDYNQNTEVRYDMQESDGKLTIHAQQDVEPLLDHLKDRRGHKDKGNFRHYCSIPTFVEIELRNKGINIYNKAHTPRVLREINENYPKLKATRMHHEIKG